MIPGANEPSELPRGACAGDTRAQNKLLALYRDRLRGMMRLRHNRRLQGRVDPSHVLQEAYLEICKDLPASLQSPTMPFFLWLRHVASQKRIAMHRRPLGAQTRCWASRSRRRATVTSAP
jgi:RNA polymerase sigma-70 factor (ECF subfamily)